MIYHKLILKYKKHTNHQRKITNGYYYKNMKMLLFIMLVIIILKYIKLIFVLIFNLILYKENVILMVQKLKIKISKTKKDL